MPKLAGCEWGIFYDSVHAFTVDFERQEARLFETSGHEEGILLMKRDESAARVSLTDPYQLINMAFHFIVSYDLLKQIADEKALKFLEQVGAKEFLERLAAATTLEDRRNRFNGLGPKFTSFVKHTKPLEQPKQAAEAPSANAKGKSK